MKIVLFIDNFKKEMRLIIDSTILICDQYEKMIYNFLILFLSNV